MEDYDLKEIKEFLGFEPKVLYEFRRAFPGWESDSKGWIVEDSLGKKMILLTNHGGMYFGTKEEVHDDINRYERLITEAKEALDLIPFGQRL